MKYISISDKIYEITKISFFYMEVEVTQTDFTVDEVLENEVWDISEFKDYKVKLINNGSKSKIVDFAVYKKHD